MKVLYVYLHLLINKLDINSVNINWVLKLLIHIFNIFIKHKLLIGDSCIGL